ncbi:MULTISPECIES: CVNH domain-containing protein [Microvirga]|uniref:CVNH domain-containing protein n=1 Tax=Microvirga TaxID=186650 RepID=UPI0021C63826|nr:MULTISPECIES: CVNH domain-containing protein [unclassified Microvirga]
MRHFCLVFVVAAAGWAAATIDASAQAGGSFYRTCTDIRQRGPFLTALCQDRFGRLVESQLNLRACPGGRAANANGRLVCEGGGRPVYREPRPRYGSPYDDRGRYYEEYRRPGPRDYYEEY